MAGARPLWHQQRDMEDRPHSTSDSILARLFIPRLSRSSPGCAACPTRAPAARAGVAAPERHARSGHPQQQELLRGHADQGRAGAVDLHPGAPPARPPAPPGPACDTRLSSTDRRQQGGCSSSTWVLAMHALCMTGGDFAASRGAAMPAAAARGRPHASLGSDSVLGAPSGPDLGGRGRAGARGGRLQGRGGGGV